MSQKKGSFGKLFLSVLVIVILVFVIGNLGSDKPKSSGIATKSKPKASLSQSVKYLSDISEVSWIEVNDNNVYVGFNPVPSDWNAIIRAAALQGNKATNYGVHVWAIRGAQKGWRPGDSGLVGEVTARYGKIE